MRRRWVYPSNGEEPYEVSNDYTPPPRYVSDSILWNDRTYQDGNDPRFSSRSQHRDFMKQHGLTTVDDYKEEWRDREKQRVEVKHGIDPTRRKAIERSIDRINDGYKPKLGEYNG